MDEKEKNEICSYAYMLYLSGESGDKFLQTKNISQKEYKKWYSSGAKIKITITKQQFNNITFFKNTKMENIEFIQCSFNKVSFADTLIMNTHFRHCFFDNCYFREAKFENIVFVGSKFFNCNLKNTKIKNSDVRYVEFYNTYVNKNVIEKNSIPQQENISRLLFRNLRKEAINAGDYELAEDYYVEETRSTIKYKKNVVKCDKDYYKERYKGRERFYAFLYVLGYELVRFIFGIRLRLRRLIPLTLSVLIFFSFVYLKIGLNNQTSVFSSNFYDSLLFSFLQFFGFGYGFMDKNRATIELISFMLINHLFGWMILIVAAARLMKILTRRTQ
ncbi:MAG: pentapeptide repeat-containing protein [Acholeplasmataceae bacterium]|jgi:hypothetical protein|nr:pentapeptide repeat-containing protein [Acholeplasmataceae bacterium]